jgi:hypothetical protein
MPARTTLDGQVMFPSEYLATPDLKGRDVTLTITDVRCDKVMKEGGKVEMKYVLYFAGTAKKMILNRKSQPEAIAAMYGTEARGWIGKRITLYPAKTKFGKEIKDCMRIREVVPPPPKQQPSQQPPAQPDPPASSPESAQEFADSIGGELTGGEA